MGTVKFINTEKGFGFIKSENKDFFFHISKIKDLIINNLDYVVFDYRASKSHKDKFEITYIVLPNNENVLQLSKHLSNLEILSLNRQFPNLIDELTKEKVADFKQEIENKAQKIILEFDLLAFSETIDAKIKTYKRKKPGDDDSFGANIESVFPDSTDKYLESLNPHFIQNTYNDCGFYCCYQMERK